MKNKEVPQKRFYRQRAHCNPLSDSYIRYPLNSKYVNWSLHFPYFFKNEHREKYEDICIDNGTTDVTETNIEHDEQRENAQNGKTKKDETKKDKTQKDETNNIKTYDVKTYDVNNNSKQIEKLDEKKKENKKERTLYLNTNKYPIFYNNIINNKYNLNEVKILDIGCGYGGLLFALSKIYQDKLILGVEIRDKITNYVGEKINAYRINHNPFYNNISIIRTNVIKFLPNYIEKNQLEKLFFCFPDPHFKKHNWRRRIITLENLSLYYYVLKKNGLIYFITDVYTLYLWVKYCFMKYPHFKILHYQEYKNDLCVKLIHESSEESKKVKRSRHNMYCCVVQKIK